MKQIGLLKVVAVMGIAVAMLFPVWSGASVVNNLKDIGLAEVMHATDLDQDLPHLPGTGVIMTNVTLSMPVSTVQFMDSEIGLIKLIHGGLAWGDYNNDGNLDLAVCGQDSSGSHTEIYRNNGDGTFTDINAGLTGLAYGELAWGDYNNDGNLDLAVCGQDNTKIYRNNGDSTFTDITVGLIVVGLPGVSWGSIAWGDYNNDGKLDLAISGQVGSNSYITKIYRNNGNGTFADIEAGLPGLYGGSLAWGDYNNDGSLDLVICGALSRWNDSNRITKIYRNNGNGTFTDIEAGLPGVSRGSIAWGDYNNDGKLDLAMGGNGLGKIYRNNGDGTFTDIATELPDVFWCSLAWGDYDNDGNLDLGICGQVGMGYVTKIYRNNGDGSFTDTETPLTGVGQSYSHSLIWGDYDNDGDIDLMIAGWGYGYPVTTIYQNLEADYNNPNTIPLAPENLTYEEDGNNVILKWNPGYDEETPDNGLYYNLRVGTTPGGNDVVSGIYGSPLLGNYLRPKLDSNQLGVILNNLSNGVYFWSVQTIDTSLEASEWSEESFMIIFEPLEANLNISPQVINRNDHNEWGRIMAWIQMPKGITKDQIDENILLKMYPGDISAIMQHVIQYGRRGTQQTRIYAFFSRDELLDAVPDNGLVELTVVGKLKTGQYFYGTDTVNIKGQHGRQGSSRNKR